MNKEQKHVLIILAVVVLVVLLYVLSGLYLQLEPRRPGGANTPGTRMEKIREGFTTK